MPSFVVHGLIPPLLLLALRLAPPRVVLFMLPFTFLPDLDYWIGIHRATLSNVFVLLPGLVLWRRWRETKPARAQYAAVATFYLASHILMDIFAGGIVLFWPLWDQNFFFVLQVIVDTATNTPVTDLDVGTESGAPSVAPFFVWLSVFETAMIALTVAVSLGALLYRRAERRREVFVEEIEN